LKKVLKWIMWILIGLVVIAVVVGAGFMVARRVGTVRWMRENRLAQRGNVEPGKQWQDKPRQAMPGQNKPQRNLPWNNSPRNFGRDEMPMYRYGGMSYYHFGGLMLVGRLVGGIFRLAILGLVIFLAVTLALRQKQAKQPVSANVVQQETESTLTAGMACPHCAREIQADWKHCPYCGNSLEPTQPDVPLT
jgi:hypothetical protein